MRTMTRRGFAGLAAGIVAVGGARWAVAHGDEPHGSPEAGSTPEAAHGGGTGAAYFTIANGGDADERLVAAASEVAAAVEIHEMAMKDGVMEMSPLPDGLAIPAGETVTLEPGGYHIMLIGLTRDLRAGESFALTLAFDAAGDVEIEVPVFVSERAAEAAARPPVTHGDLTIADIWARHAPALLGETATPVASPTH